MREILFRAKRIDNGEWAEGYLFDDGMAEVEHYFVGRIVVEPYKGTACDDWDITGIDFCEVNPETLCQYTGLKDKNGKRIWENDIVYMRSSGLSGHGIIEYENGCLVVKDGRRGRTYSLFGEWKLRADGNIFDNPELL